jgi:hypothetical protein
MKVEKQKTRDLLDGSFDFEGSIDDLIHRLKITKTLYGDRYSRFFFEMDYVGEYRCYQLFGEREETDEEAERRVAAANKRKQAQTEREAALYEVLKAKFEQKGA